MRKWNVALCMSAWIEIYLRQRSVPLPPVALCMSAWIEIYTRHALSQESQSRTLYECVD